MYIPRADHSRGRIIRAYVGPDPDGFIPRSYNGTAVPYSTIAIARRGNAAWFVLAFSTPRSIYCDALNRFTRA